MNRVVISQVQNPFPGLRPFREEEEHLFFGRESQIHTMVNKLFATRFLAVVGTSGSGKSSLVNCGLRPALHRGLMAAAGTSWRIAQFRPGGNPLKAMARALAQKGVLFDDFDSSTLMLEDIIEAALRMSKLGLSRVYENAHVRQGINLLVIVDQFEELFRYRGTQASAALEAQQRAQESTAFVNLLLEPRTQTNLPIYVVLTMRSDFLGDCAEFPGLPEAINEGEYLIPRLTREERKAAIAGPIAVGGAKVTPVLLTRLVNDVGDNPDQLSILQHALNRTWARWGAEGVKQGPLDLCHYEAIGTMAHALDHHAEKAYAELPDERHRNICRKIFKALTDKGTDPRGIRRPTRFKLLCELAEADPGEVAEVIDVFRKPSRSFLMPPLPETLETEPIIDISHESLMRVWERLIVWTDEEVQSSRLYHRLAETAALHARGKAALWDDPDLQFALDWRKEQSPTKAWAELYGGGFDEAMGFLVESEAQRDKKVQETEERQNRELRQAQDLAAERQKRIEAQGQAAVRLRWGLVGLGFVVLVLLFVTGYAVVKRHEAIQAKTTVTVALGQAKEALEAETKEKDEATRAKNEAELADTEMRLEGLRVRDVLLNSQSTLSDVADRAIDSTPEKSEYFRLIKGQMLLNLGDYDEAKYLLSKVLDSAPDDMTARTSQGYISVLRNNPQEALKDFEYYRDHIDRTSPLNNLNLTVAYAMAGKYQKARNSLKASIENMRYKDSEGGQESVIPPDITRATGRTTLEARGAAFKAALYYMRANLEAYEGRDIAAFTNALGLADEQVKDLSDVAKKDAYFVAMTWAWLHLQVRCPAPGVGCKDYGAFASQAALWEKAGYKNWAACYYDKFREADKQGRDTRYPALAQWVEQSRSALGGTSSNACEVLKDPVRDIFALQVEAKEARERRKFGEAKELLAKALKKAKGSEEIGLLIDQAELLATNFSDEQRHAQDERSIINLYDPLIEALQKKEDEEPPSHDSTSKREGVPSKRGKLIVALRTLRDQHQQKQKQHQEEQPKILDELYKTCSQILKRNPESSTAYFYRAYARQLLDPGSRELVFADLRRSLKFDPANLNALDMIDTLVPDDKSEKEQEEYFERYHEFLVRYYRMSPYSANTVMHQAKLAKRDKRYIDALEFIDKAILMEPDHLSFYDLRAEIQRALGFNESQVKRNLIGGYRQAERILRIKRQTQDAQDAGQRASNILAELAKSRTNENIQCDTELATCNITRTVPVKSEEIFSRILEVKEDKRNAASLAARIDKGSEDGIVVGSRGDVWSHYSGNQDGHKREATKIGEAEIVSVETHSALVTIKVDKPASDGLVRKQDSVRLRARIPKSVERSPLWTVAKYDVTLLDLDDKLILDYQTLYSSETPDLDSKLLQRMLDDIHKAGFAFRDRLDNQWMKGRPVPQGIFAGQKLSEAMQNTSINELKRFIELLAKNPDVVFGQERQIYDFYAAWVSAGTPD